MKKLHTLFLAWVLMALSAVAHAQIELYQPPLLPPRAAVPAEPEKAEPENKIIASDFLPGERVWVPCLPTINGVAGTAQGFILESTYTVSAKKIERLIGAVCISLSAELVLRNFKPDTREDLRKLPIILVPMVKETNLNAYYDLNSDVVVVADGFLSPTVPVSALIFTLTHEIAHRQHETGIKVLSMQGGGTATAAAGVVMMLNPLRTAALAKRGVKAAGALLAAGGAVAMVCPSKYWDNEISADQYAARALFAFYNKTESASLAKQRVLADAQSLMRLSPGAKDEDCFTVKSKPNGDKDVSFNSNPHPGPVTRMKYIRKALNLD